MRFETRYHHVPASDSLNAFISDKLKNIDKRYQDRGDGVKVTFQIDQAHHTREGKTDLFLVEGILHRPRRASLVVKKENSNVHQCVIEVIQVLEKMLRRESETSEHVRKTMGRTHTPARDAKLELAARAFNEKGLREFGADTDDEAIEFLEEGFENLDEPSSGPTTTAKTAEVEV